MKPIDQIARYVADLRAEPALEPFANDMERALSAIDLEADTNPHAAAQFEAVRWIMRQPRTVREKTEVLARLVTQPPGRVRIPSIKAFAGWQ